MFRNPGKPQTQTIRPESTVISRLVLRQGIQTNLQPSLEIDLEGCTFLTSKKMLLQILAAYEVNGRKEQTALQLVRSTKEGGERSLAVPGTTGISGTLPWKAPRMDVLAVPGTTGISGTLPWKTPRLDTLSLLRVLQARTVSWLISTPRPSANSHSVRSDCLANY